MANYSTSFNKGVPPAASANFRSIGRLMSTAAQRLRIYDLVIGSSEATPSDLGFVHEVRRVIVAADGVSTAVTPSPVDSADPATPAIGAHIFTTEPTVSGVSLLQFGLNKRGTLRWVAAPGSELVVPASATQGILLLLSLASTDNFAAAMMHAE